MEQVQIPTICTDFQEASDNVFYISPSNIPLVFGQGAEDRSDSSS